MIRICGVTWIIYLFSRMPLPVPANQDRLFLSNASSSLIRWNLPSLWCILRWEKIDNSPIQQKEVEIVSLSEGLIFVRKSDSLNPYGLDAKLLICGRLNIQLAALRPLYTKFSGFVLGGAYGSNPNYRNDIGRIQGGMARQGCFQVPSIDLLRFCDRWYYPSKIISCTLDNGDVKIIDAFLGYAFAPIFKNPRGTCFWRVFVKFFPEWGL